MMSGDQGTSETSPLGKRAVPGRDPGYIANLLKEGSIISEPKPMATKNEKPKGRKPRGGKAASTSSLSESIKTGIASMEDSEDLLDYDEGGGIFRRI